MTIKGTPTAQFLLKGEGLYDPLMEDGRYDVLGIHNAVFEAVTELHSQPGQEVTGYTQWAQRYRQLSKDPVGTVTELYQALDRLSDLLAVLQGTETSLNPDRLPGSHRTGLWVNVQSMEKAPAVWAPGFSLGYTDFSHLLFWKQVDGAWERFLPTLRGDGLVILPQGSKVLVARSTPAALPARIRQDTTPDGQREALRHILRAAMDNGRRVKDLWGTPTEVTYTYPYTSPGTLATSTIQAATRVDKARLRAKETAEAGGASGVKEDVWVSRREHYLSGRVTGLSLSLAWQGLTDPGYQATSRQTGSPTVVQHLHTTPFTGFAGDGRHAVLAAGISGTLQVEHWGTSDNEPPVPVQNTSTTYESGSRVINHTSINGLWALPGQSVTVKQLAGSFLGGTQQPSVIVRLHLPQTAAANALRYPNTADRNVLNANLGVAVGVLAAREVTHDSKDSLYRLVKGVGQTSHGVRWYRTKGPGTLSTTHRLLLELDNEMFLSLVLGYDEINLHNYPNKAPITDSFSGVEEVGGLFFFGTAPSGYTTPHGVLEKTAPVQVNALSSQLDTCRNEGIQKDATIAQQAREIDQKTQQITTLSAEKADLQQQLTQCQNSPGGGQGSSEEVATDRSVLLERTREGVVALNFKESLSGYSNQPVSWSTLLDSFKAPGNSAHPFVCWYAGRQAPMFAWDFNSETISGVQFTEVPSAPLEFSGTYEEFPEGVCFIVEFFDSRTRDGANPWQMHEPALRELTAKRQDGRNMYYDLEFVRSWCKKHKCRIHLGRVVMGDYSPYEYVYYTSGYYIFHRPTKVTP